ncbi:MAG: N-acetylglucosamine-6-phosphate deacetylase [Planctomycetota bacterium]
MNIPGFVDLQVNGYLNVSFSNLSLSPGEFRRVARALLAHGTAAFLPTVVTSPVEVYRRNLPLIAAAMKEEEFRGRILGIHLEGPFISPEPGAVGAHNPEWVQAPSEALFDDMMVWSEGSVKFLTIAAEAPGAESLARRAAKRGVTVSVGHSLWTEDSLGRMAAAGATVITHLGNGLPNLLPRHPNPIWTGIADDRFTAMIITDGHHLPAAVVKTILRAKGVARTVVTSDASSLAGMPPGRYHGRENLVVLEPNGRLHHPEKGCLAGSSFTLLRCMNYLASLGILGEADLVRVGFENPLRLIGLASKDVPAGGGVTFDGKSFRVAAGAERS